MINRALSIVSNRHTLNQLTAKQYFTLHYILFQFWPMNPAHSETSLFAYLIGRKAAKYS